MELLTGFTELCDASGGVDVAYIASISDCETGASNVDTLEITDNEVTTMAMAATKKFYPFLFEQETWNATDVKIGSKVNRSNGREKTVTGTLAGNTPEMATTFDTISTGRVMVIVKTNDGKNKLFFHEKGAFVKDDYASGTSIEDLNGYTITMTAREKKRAPYISDAILATLL